MNDVLMNKAQIIERCIRRIHEEYAGIPEHLHNFTKQDSIILNIQRACEASIDLAMYIVSVRKLGIPQNSRDAFDLLYQQDLISAEMCENMSRMIGFRNIAVHNYQQVNLDIVEKIIKVHLTDIQLFSIHILKSFNVV